MRAVEAVDEHRWPPNWWRAIRFDDDTDASSACRSVAALIVATLLGVHRIPETEPLELQSFPATPCRVCKR